MDVCDDMTVTRCMATAERMRELAGILDDMSYPDPVLLRELYLTCIDVPDMVMTLTFLPNRIMRLEATVNALARMCHDRQRYVVQYENYKKMTLYLHMLLTSE